MTAADTRSAGDPIPGECAVIEVRVSELLRLFNAIDPSPFKERDLDRNAEEFIISWARELPPTVPLALLVHLERGPGVSDESAVLRDAIHEFFSQRALSGRRRLRRLFRLGRTSLAIGLAFVVVSLLLADLAATWLEGTAFSAVVREGISILGWVAMWRPLEVFLYDWWPIRAEVRLDDRLAAMPVRIKYAGQDSDAWQHDWPVVRSEPRRQ